MRLPTSEHTERPWRIHEITGDFKVEDVWALPTPGGPEDLPRLVSSLVSLDFPEGEPLVVRLLWSARWKLGALFGWDRAKDRVGARVPSLRGRMPSDLRDANPGPELGDDDPFTSLYLLQDEWAAELANRTVHAVIHLGWVPDGSGGYRGQMAVLVKPNGWFGTAYMAAIKPFRYLFVYPALMRRIERHWRASAPLSTEPRQERSEGSPSSLDRIHSYDRRGGRPPNFDAER